MRQNTQNQQNNMKKTFNNNKKFMCPYCGEDIRECGIDYLQNATESSTALYSSNGEYSESDYGDSEYGDTSDIRCGKCGEELHIDPFEPLDFSNYNKQ